MDETQVAPGTGGTSPAWVGPVVVAILTLFAVGATAVILSAKPEVSPSSCLPRPPEGVVVITKSAATGSDDQSSEVAPSTDDPQAAQTSRECREARWFSDVAVVRYESTTLGLMATAAVVLLIAGSRDWAHVVGRSTAAGSLAFFAASFVIWFSHF